MTQNVPFILTADTNLYSFTYIIPRFSSILAGGTTFSLTSDLVFSKLTNDVETINDINNSHLLHQGVIEEHPLYNALGIDNEVLFLSLPESVKVDHFNIFVYVKTGNNSWREFTRVEDRSTYQADAEIFEIRFNSNKHYEISFGDNINGRALKNNDSVAVYYLSINENAQTIGAHALDNQRLSPFNSLQYTEILKDTSNAFGKYLTSDQFDFVQFSNTLPSSNYAPEENVDAIKINAPKIFRSQHRLVSLNDYDYFISTNFKNLIINSKVVNNDDYLRGHVRYLYYIGLKSPQTETTVLLNQVKFANSCNFNNIYIYAIPHREMTYLSSQQKEYVLNETNKLKTLTSHIVFMDPEYMKFDFFVKDLEGNFSSADINKCKLRIHKSNNARRSNSAILFDVIQVIKNAFDKSLITLGQDINTHQLSTDILSIDGVQSIETYRSDLDVGVKEISFLVWNSKYPNDDVNVYTQSVRLDYFQYPVFNNIENISNRIEIIDSLDSVKIPEF